jgi:hypothetical protein
VVNPASGRTLPIPLIKKSFDPSLFDFSFESGRFAAAQALLGPDQRPRAGKMFGGFG